MDPKVYQQQLYELGIDGMEIDVSTIERAMRTLNELEEYEGVLKKMRHNIRMDIRNIRKEYLVILKELNPSPEEKRKSSAKEVQKRIKKKKSILKKRDSKIKSYEIIENTVDSYLTQIDDARIYIKNSIETRVG
jgi:DNA polymerase elongation subunit (family B)